MAGIGQMERGNGGAFIDWMEKRFTETPTKKRIALVKPNPLFILYFF